MRGARGWAARIAQSLLDAFGVITGFYYSRKYAGIVRRLGVRHQTTGDPADAGLVIIQIDGLAYDHLVQAMERGCLPHIKVMLEGGEVALSKWRCGLPSSTPAVQAGIMFGDNDNVPAFRWYDKAQGTSVVCKLPGVAPALQTRLSRGKRGILTGGSSYVNIFDGDASRSLFTLSALEPRRLFEGVQGLGFVGLFLLNPFRALRVIYLAVKEYITDGVQRLTLWVRGRSRLPVLGLFPFLRICSNVILREIVTFVVLVDIYRGVPAIYATYYGYDEVAHHFGVNSLPARQALRDIDHCIGQVERLRRANLSRPYALYLLGDHGLTPAQPFTERYGRSLGQYVADCVGSQVSLHEHAGGERQHLLYTQFLVDELKAIELNLPRTAGRVSRRIRLLVERRVALNRSELSKWDILRRCDVVVKNSGSLAHVYFNIARHRMDLSEVSAAFPGLVVELLGHEGIWLAVAREGRQCLIMAQDGILTLDAEGRPGMEGANPLRRLPEPWLGAEQLCRIASFSQSGDLILLGSYDPKEDLVVCFESQCASHGGLGGAQDYPFIMYPRHLEWDLAQVRNSCDLYGLFARERGFASDEQGRELENPHECQV